MGLLEFDKLPINTLVGADWDTFRKVTARQQIDKGFKGKYRLTTGVCRLLSALSWGIGGVVRLLFITSSPAISISVIPRRTRRYSRT